jgi:hypothetical protein
VLIRHAFGGSKNLPAALCADLARSAGKFRPPAACIVAPGS